MVHVTLLDEAACSVHHASLVPFRIRVWQYAQMVCALACCMMAAGCSLLPHAASASDPPTLYVWPEPLCPSGNQHGGELVTATQNLLGGDLIGAAVGVLASSLTAAAAADKAGYQVSSTRSIYYQTAEWSAAGNKYNATAPTCYVVALSKPDAVGKDWCTDPAFKTALSDTCGHGGSVVTVLSTTQGLPNPQPTTLPLTVPTFYAEIALEPTSDPRPSAQTFKIVQPRIAAMYYPHSLLGGVFEQNKKEHVALTLAFSNPNPNSKADYYKAASVALDIYNIKPSNNLTPGDIGNNTQTAWALVPIETVPNGLSYQDASGNPADGPFEPVTVTASIHEVGDPNAFLQALTGAFASSTSTNGATNALSNALLPQGQLTQEQNDSTLQGNIGKYYTAVASYKSACVTLRTDENTPANASKVAADKATLSAALYNAQSAYTTASASALQSNAASLPAQQSLSCP